MSDNERCKAKVPEAGRLGWLHTLQCSRSAWKDGYCKQHHPDTVKERQDKASAEWKRKWDAERKRDQLRAAAPDLLAALKRFVAYGDTFVQDNEGNPYEQALAAIRKAEGDA